MRGLLTAQDGYGAMIVRLLKSSGIYAIASMGSPLVSLILTPFLAHNLTQSDYGVFATLVTIVTLGGGITQLGLGSAFFRAYNYDYPEARDRRGVLATTILLLVLALVPLELLGLLAPSFSAGLVLGRQPVGSVTLAHLMMLAVLVIFAQNLSVPAFAWMRAESRAPSYALLSLINLSVNLGANLLLVGFLHWGILGALLSIGLGFLSVDLIMLPLILLRGRLRFRRDIAWNMLTFGVPQVGSVISFWILQLSDRELLIRMAGPTVTASYSVAYSLGSVLSTVVITPFNLAWPTTMYAIANRPDAARVYQQVFRYLGLLLLFAAFGISLVSSLLLDVLFPRSYHAAALVIPIIALSIVFYGAYLLFVTGVSIRRLTWLATLYMTLAALSNVGINLVLIPRFAAMGAAASTLVAYVILAAVTYLVNRRIYPIPFEIGRFLLAAATGAAIFTASYVAAQTLGTWARWPLSIGGLIVYAGFLVLFARVGVRRSTHVVA
jgi:O-antigen/teichoic acid export membrane protein